MFKIKLKEENYIDIKIYLSNKFELEFNDKEFVISIKNLDDLILIVDFLNEYKLNYKLVNIKGHKLIDKS